MKLIGMLDSPFVRRVAVTLNCYQLDYEHCSLSVFQNYDAFKELSPIVKAPTLLLDTGQLLIDSTLIIDYLDKINVSGCVLRPESESELVSCSELVGIALAANEKSVQAMYERTLRSPEQHSADWFNRVVEQLHTAYQLLEQRIIHAQGFLVGNALTHADVAVTVAWAFTQRVVSDVITPRAFPKIAEYAAFIESFDSFKLSPIDYE